MESVPINVVGTCSYRECSLRLCGNNNPTTILLDWPYDSKSLIRDYEKKLSDKLETGKYQGLINYLLIVKVSGL